MATNANKSNRRFLEAVDAIREHVVSVTLAYPPYTKYLTNVEAILETIVAEIENDIDYDKHK
jgi:pyruvate-formate lyase-activating enzyme